MHSFFSHLPLDFLKGVLGKLIRRAMVTWWYSRGCFLLSVNLFFFFFNFCSGYSFLEISLLSSLRLLILFLLLYIVYLYCYNFLFKLISLYYYLLFLLTCFFFPFHAGSRSLLVPWVYSIFAFLVGLQTG